MSRELRPRKGHNYATLAGDIAEDDAGPSSSNQFVGDDDQGSSGSDFDMDEDAHTSQAKTQTKAKAKAKKPFIEMSKAATLPAAPGLPRPSNRKMYVLPIPSVNHRHRAMPLFFHTGRVERLTSPPVLFKEPKTTYTHNFTHNASVTDRVGKAWGYNVGPGPLWALMEDRGWFKEGRRPRVGEGVGVCGGWEILDDEEDVRLHPPPAITCYFGPVENQTRTEMRIFETRKMCTSICNFIPLFYIFLPNTIGEFFPASKSHIFNAGAQVWGIDWCPIEQNIADRLRSQYLAVAPFPSASHSPGIGIRTPRPCPACIQIWSLKPSSNVHEPTEDCGEMTCEMVLCTDGGPAFELKWCPLPSHDLVHICSFFLKKSQRCSDS
jgi:transcription factor C subunit 6